MISELVEGASLKLTMVWGFLVLIVILGRLSLVGWGVGVGERTGIGVVSSFVSLGRVRFRDFMATTIINNDKENIRIGFLPEKRLSASGFLFKKKTWIVSKMKNRLTGRKRT